MRSSESSHLSQYQKHSETTKPPPKHDTISPSILKKNQLFNFDLNDFFYIFIKEFSIPNKLKSQRNDKRNKRSSSASSVSSHHSHKSTDNQPQLNTTTMSKTQGKSSDFGRSWNSSRSRGIFFSKQIKIEFIFSYLNSIKIKR